VWRGGGGACGRVCTPLPGGFGAPPWGYYGPCARSSLEGSAGDGQAGRGCDDPLRGTGVQARRSQATKPYKRGPESEIADERSATGRADGGSIHPRRFLAQWKRLTIHPRLAALRCPSFITERGDAGG